MDGSLSAQLHITHLKQNIINACGTIALLHCITNTSNIKVEKNQNLLENLLQERTITDASEQVISGLHSHFAN